LFLVYKQNHEFHTIDSASFPEVNVLHI